MKKTIVTVISVLIILVLSFLSLYFNNPIFTDNQRQTFYLLLIICGISILYCFIVGEISRNNSQMDKLWSVLPIIYVWVIAFRGELKLRLVIYALLVTVWGIRLTFNFARKGAYSIKFWQGEEDYRWQILRNKKPFTNKFVWALFDLFFISFYQNALVLAITLPMLASMESNASFNFMDVTAIILTSIFLIIEFVADEQQWKFQQTKKAKLKEGHLLEELEKPYNLGFNTVGLWSRFRHRNYLGEQGTWLALYLFVIASQECVYGIFNWSFVGPLFLVLLFIGSSTFGEKISKSKYPKYQLYQEQVYKYLPLRKFQDD